MLVLLIREYEGMYERIEKEGGKLIYCRISLKSLGI